MANELNFNEQYYLSQNPDVAAAVSRGLFKSGFEHFETNGRFEGRDPNAFFDTSYYLGQYPDVAAAGVDPLAHFLAFGAAEGRFANANVAAAIDENGDRVADEFDAAAYLAGNPDVAAAGVNPLQHFLTFGQFEGRVASLMDGTPIVGPFGVNGNGSLALSLTAGIDTLNGSAGNDVFTAGLAINPSTGAATVETLGAFDTVNGGQGNDTLNVFTNTGTLAAATLNSIEALNISSTTGVTANVGGTNITGLTTLSARATAGAVDIDTKANVTSVAVTGSATTVAIDDNGATGADKLASVSVSGNTAAVTVASDALTSLSLTNSSAGATVSAASGTRALGVTVNNVTGGTIQDATATTLTVNANGAASSGLTLNAASATSVTINADEKISISDVNIAAAKTLTITGDSAVTIGATSTVTALTSIDASASTGGVTLTPALGTSVAFTGSAGADAITVGASTKAIALGAGNDTVTTAAALGTGGTVDGGADTDTLIVGSATDINTSTLGAKYTNFETLRVSGSQNVSFVSGITAVQVNAATSATISGLTATQANNITLLGDQSTAFTVTLADATGTSDAVTLNLANATATADVDVAGLSIVGVETLNVQALSGGTSLTTASTLDSIAFAAGGADRLSTINLSGDRSVDLSLANVAGAVTVNASLTGDAALLLSSGATVGGSVVNATANADSLALATVSSGVVTYNAGAGNDTVIGTAAQLANHVLDGSTGTDTLSITDTTSAVALGDSAFQAVTNFETVSFASTTGNLSLTSAAFFDTNFKAGGVGIVATGLTSGTATIDLSTFTGNATVTIGTTASTGAQSVTTGSGIDTITLNGAATTLTAVAGAGDDTININGTAATTGATATGGLGKDMITFSDAIANTNAAAVITVNVGAGESTTSGFDVVKGFDLGTASLFSSKLDFDGTATVGTIAANTAVTGFTASQLTASTSNGIVTFSGTSASGLTVDQKIAIVDSLVNTDNATVAFVDNGNTYVFHDSATTNGDSVVELVGVTATSVATTNATTAGLLHIA